MNWNLNIKLKTLTLALIALFSKTPKKGTVSNFGNSSFGNYNKCVIDFWKQGSRRVDIGKEIRLFYSG